MARIELRLPCRLLLLLPLCRLLRDICPPRSSLGYREDHLSLRLFLRMGHPMQIVAIRQARGPLEYHRIGIRQVVLRMGLDQAGCLRMRR